MKSFLKNQIIINTVNKTMESTKREKKNNHPDSLDYAQKTCSQLG